MLRNTHDLRFVANQQPTSRRKIEEKLEGTSHRPEELVTAECFIKGLFEDLNDIEKSVISANIIQGYKLEEIVELLGASKRQVTRYKAAAMKRLIHKLKKMRIISYAEAIRNLY